MTLGVTTDRLLLRKSSMGDSDLISDILSSPDQTRFLPNKKPYDRHQQETYLQNRIAHWGQYDFGTFIIVLKDKPDTKLGFVGAEYAPNPEYVDIRFEVPRQFEGKGVVTEATKALIDWFFSNTSHVKLYGVSMIENHGSKAVLTKIGMVPERGGTYIAGKGWNISFYIIE